MESFKNIILPDYVIADLYKAPIVQDPTQPAATQITSEPFTDGMLPEMPQVAEVPAEPTTYRFLGKNQRKVSVIARYPDDPYIPEDHLQFLVRILSACKLNLGDVAIINDSVARVQMDLLKTQLQPRYLMMFDIEPSEIGLPISFPLLKPQQFDDVQMLAVPPISSMLPDTEAAKGLKKQLWESLKKIFSV
ncbi:MAG: hypothetical protein EOO01_08530 [Chitinophagaceae bacterium]|nr:MAG: hypothetical protein EOO01_08530 [Chitinophagaceae bacterium]